jgi:ankyrin repeat protein
MQKQAQSAADFVKWSPGFQPRAIGPIRTSFIRGCSIRARDIDRLAELLASGADPNIPSTSGSTPLLVAVYELEALSELEPGGPIDAVVLLLRYGVRANDWNEGHRTTPLLEAVMINHIEAVRILLAAGADPNVRGEERSIGSGRFCLKGRRCRQSAVQDGPRRTVALGPTGAVGRALNQPRVRTSELGGSRAAGAARAMRRSSSSRSFARRAISTASARRRWRL